VVTESGSGRPAVVLFSGGLDSTTLLTLVMHEGWRAYALTCRYGQRHTIEVDVARRAAARLRATRPGLVEHVVAEFDLRAFGGSALTSEMAVPKHHDTAHIGSSVPATYVPARNTIFLAFALAWAEALGADDIFIGVNALDYSGYPDCRLEYIRAFEAMANLATKASTEDGRRMRVHAPLIAMNKRDIITLGTRLGVDYAQTLSCYDPAPDGAACGACDACLLRRKGFAEAGIADPARYVVRAGVSIR
jgi:7-cyano-7-deazaguanine synthase